MLATFLLIASPTAMAGELLPQPKPTALLHAWTTLYDMDEQEIADPSGYGDPEDDMGFKLRRARFGFTGRNNRFSYNFVGGMGSPFDTSLQRVGSEFGLIDAHLGWSPLHSKRLWFYGGVQKVPISREQIMSSSDLVFSERAVSSVWLVPNREVGIVVDYNVGPKRSKVRTRLGVFNGNQSLTGDDNDGKLLVARLDYRFGKGNAFKTYGVVKNPILGIGGDFFVNQELTTQTTAFGGDIMFRIEGLAVMAEFRTASLEPINSDLDLPGVLSDTQRMGYLAQVGYTIRRFEIASRYSAFDDNRDETNYGDVSEVLSGLTYHNKDDSLRVGGGYVLRLENGGPVVENDTARMWMHLRF